MTNAGGRGRSEVSPLAETGFAGAPLGFAALLLILAGAAVVASRRRNVA
ncbi:LPXTG cell wall anchor domain-containing protein [Cryobacterium sp. TMT1-2-2]|nr:LPXTG cell wall anchor domain-containing protein [Cryobacterium sp. TMT1-66-1]TFD13503.1 LPXTG cell wall anchor domain-containing protein [Cryobacterium sp. TMT1-2-2]